MTDFKAQWAELPTTTRVSDGTFKPLAACYVPAATAGRTAASPVPNVGAVLGQSAPGTAYETESGLY